MHTSISSSDFIVNLSFAYIETYSLQRGEEYEKRATKEEARYDRLKDKKRKNGQLSVVEEAELAALQKLYGFTQYLLNSAGQFHPSATRRHRFATGDPLAKRLKEILLIPALEIPSWMCAPVYRDAIAFYREDNTLITTLNICLECRYMETNPGNYVQCDNSTYDLLQQFFVDLGHAVEVE